VTALLGAMALFNHALKLEEWTGGVTVELAVLWSSVALSFGFLAAAGSPRLGDRRITQLAVGYVVLLCGQLAFFHAGHEVQSYGVVTAFGPFVIVMGLFPLVVDASWKLVLTTVAGSSLSSLAGLAAGLRLSPQGHEGSLLAEASVGILFGAGLAAGTQRGLSTLRREAAAEGRLGSYRLEERLGRGGMGEVWRATHPLLTRSAAIKLIRGVHLAGDPEQRERALRRFRREARTTASLQSSHTVRLFDYGVTEDGNAFIVMEMLRGFDLQELVHLFGAQPVDRVVAVLVAICDSLAEAHGRGLVHRDVKPANVMLCRQDRAVDHVKVLDFGSVTADASGGLWALGFSWDVSLDGSNVCDRS
jgi:serine/threonine-protein kinase